MTTLLNKKIIYVNFNNNKLLPELFGKQDKYLSCIEQNLNVVITARGNNLAISGTHNAIHIAKAVLQTLYQELEQGHEVNLETFISVINKLSTHQDNHSSIALKTSKRNISPYSNNQSSYLHLLQNKDIVFAVGPAGTGKTYLAVATAVQMFLNKNVERIILTRPAVEAGEKLGFLPGDLKEKIDPYLQPLYDALLDMINANMLAKYLENGEIEVAPLAFMRGRTLNNAYIILDEAQNTSIVQMKMFLTRLGRNSRIVVTGDPSQIDLLNQESGLVDGIKKLKHIPEIGFLSFNEEDIVRNPLIIKIIQAYNNTKAI